MAKNEHNATPVAPRRYYYKAKAGNGFLNLKTPLDVSELENYEEITKEEFDALTYVEPPVDTRTPEQIAADQARAEKLARIQTLKGQLNATDYVVIKIAEAATQEEQAALREEYADVIANRIAWRAEINQLEGQL